MTKTYVLKQDLVIPMGTELEYDINYDEYCVELSLGDGGFAIFSIPREVVDDNPR